MQRSEGIVGMWWQWKIKVEMDWRQRSGQLYFREGDANTRFFHLTANGRRRANQVLRAQVEDQEFVRA